MFSVEALAIALTRDSVDDLDADIAGTEHSVPVPTSIEDEDTSGNVVNEPDVHAEVRLPSTVRKFSFYCLPNTR